MADRVRAGRLHRLLGHEVAQRLDRQVRVLRGLSLRDEVGAEVHQARPWHAGSLVNVEHVAGLGAFGDQGPEQSLDVGRNRFAA